MEVYEAGALLLMALAYPEDKITDEERDNIHASLCCWALRARGNEDRDWLMNPQRIKPFYALRDTDQIAKDLKTFQRRMRDRDVAGRMAMAFLKKALSGKEPELPEGIKRLSLNEISVMVLEDAGLSDPENVESRIWRKSIPVIHLAAAIQTILQQLHKTGAPVPTHVDLLNSQSLIERMITVAEEYAPLFAKTGLDIDPQSLMQFRIVH